MAFRANEATEGGFERARQYFLSPKSLGKDDVSRGTELLDKLSVRWGPFIDSYPSWHPLVSSGNSRPACPTTPPREKSGYQGLDHTLFLRDAFITCPYTNGDEVIKSVENINYPDCVDVQCEKLDATLYNEGTTSVLVTCKWMKPPQADRTISQRCAVALMLEQEIQYWKEADYGETWETMKPFFLGQPCGSKSSLFVNQKTGQAMKKVWEAIIYAGVFGAIKVDR